MNVLDEPVKSECYSMFLYEDAKIDVLREGLSSQ